MFNATPNSYNSTWNNQGDGSFLSTTGVLFDTDEFNFYGGELLPKVYLISQGGSLNGLDAVQSHTYKHGSAYRHLNDKKTHSIGQPGELESIIPVWGSGRAAIDHFQNGNVAQGALYTALAISDLFLVKSLVTGIARERFKLLGSHTWGATRKYYLKKRFAKPNKPLHHWLIHQNGRFGKHVPNSIKNQMWNLKPMPNNLFHQSVHGRYQSL